MKTLSLISVSLLSITMRACHGFIHVEVPEECKGKDFCSVPPKNYEELQKHINSVLPEYLISEVGERMLNENSEKYSPSSDRHNCITRTQTFAVTFAGGNENVVAMTHDFKQYLTRVECANKEIPKGDEQCFNDITPNKLGLNSNCVQIKATRPLIIYDPYRNITEIRNFDVPVYCACVLSHQ